MRTPSAESLLSDIRGKCLDCCAGSRSLVDACTDRNCRLWRHRKGLAGQQETIFAGRDQLDGQIDMFERAM